MSIINKKTRSKIVWPVWALMKPSIITNCRLDHYWREDISWGLGGNSNKSAGWQCGQGGSGQDPPRTTPAEELATRDWGRRSWRGLSSRWRGDLIVGRVRRSCTPLPHHPPQTLHPPSTSALFHVHWSHRFQAGVQGGVVVCEIQVWKTKKSDI